MQAFIGIITHKNAFICAKVIGAENTLKIQKQRNYDPAFICAEVIGAGNTLKIQK